MDEKKVIRYAAQVFANRFEKPERTSLGEDIAYALLKKCTGEELTDYHKQLIEEHGHRFTK